MADVLNIVALIVAGVSVVVFILALLAEHFG
jgi:hypothetical protein